MCVQDILFENKSNSSKKLLTCDDDDEWLWAFKDFNLVLKCVY
jgi:hypothetical protein